MAGPVHVSVPGWVETGWEEGAWSHGGSSRTWWKRGGRLGWHLSVLPIWEGRGSRTGTPQLLLGGWGLFDGGRCRPRCLGRQSTQEDLQPVPVKLLVDYSIQSSLTM